MIQGKIKKSKVTVEELLFLTNGGYSIFKFYLGEVGRIMNRPGSKKERVPSWGIFPRDGIWFFKDFAKETSGNAIQFVQIYFSLSFNDAMNKICNDFGLTNNKIITNNNIKLIEYPEEKDYCQIDIISQPFQKRHHEYWNLLEVDEEHCKKMNTFAVKKISINSKYYPIKESESVFAYYAESQRAYKLYFPDRPKEKRFKNNVSGNYLWNYENIKSCNNLIIQKSNKDLLVTSLINSCVIATQSESFGIFNQDMVKKINKICKNPWIWYGSDEDGVEKCKKITSTNKWRYINTPKNLLPDVNDAAEFVKWHNLRKKGTGLKALENFMNSKGL